MLLETRKYFPIAAKSGWIQKMTTIEAFVIHLRCLINFLYPLRVDEDDILAKHFFSNQEEWDLEKPTITTPLIEARTRANKEVGHLTKMRKAIADPGKPWAINELTDEIIPILKRFCDLADKNKLDVKISTLLS